MREEVGTAMAALAAGRHLAGSRPVRSAQPRPGPGAPVSPAAFWGRQGSGVRKMLEANPFYRYSKKIQQLCRSDPAAFESWLEKRSEFSKQPGGHQASGLVSHVWNRRHWGNSLRAEESVRTRLSVNLQHWDGERQNWQRNKTDLAAVFCSQNKITVYIRRKVWFGTGLSPVQHFCVVNQEGKFMSF